MNRPVQANRYLQNAVRRGFTVKGVRIAQLLVCLLLVLNVALIAAIFLSSKGLPGCKAQDRQVEQLAKTVLKLRTQNQKLFDKIEAVKTNPEARERLVRRELGWVRENEVIMIFPGKAGGHP